MSRFQAVRGTRDILPPEVRRWQLAENRARELFARYGFAEIRTPILESYDLFARSVGESSDIVHKEMYVLQRGEERLALRPENTAGVVRAYVEHGLHRSAAGERLYYIGPQFRYERPQKGRQRQFHQIGVEVLGEASAACDAEVAAMALEYLQALRVPDVTLRVNSVGDDGCRPAYRDALRKFLAPRLGALCADCRRRYQGNPLRVLDCKVEADRRQLSDAPRLVQHLCPACRSHHDAFLDALRREGMAFQEDPSLVRGLDYYVRSTFEVASGALGAQDAVLGGGRYDRLVEDLGGPAVPGVGFAIGLERLIMLIPEDHPELPAPGVDLVLVGVGEAAHTTLPDLARRLRAAGLSVRHAYEPRALGNQMKRAGRLQARLVVIRGDAELAAGTCVVKRMADGHQEVVTLDELEPRAAALLQAEAR